MEGGSTRAGQRLRGKAPFPFGKAVLLLCLCPCLADGLHSGLAVATGWIPCLRDVSHLNAMCHVSAGMRWPIDQSYAKELRP